MRGKWNATSSIEHALQDDARFLRHCTFMMTTVMMGKGVRHSARKSPKTLGREAVPGVHECPRASRQQSKPPTKSKVVVGVARGPFQWFRLVREGMDSMCSYGLADGDMHARHQTFKEYSDYPPRLK